MRQCESITVEKTISKELYDKLASNHTKTKKDLQNQLKTEAELHMKIKSLEKQITLLKEQLNKKEVLEILQRAMNSKTASEFSELGLSIEAAMYLQKFISDVREIHLKEIEQLKFNFNPDQISN